MYDELKSIINNSYCKFSKFKVACIVKMKDGTTFSGVNVENPSFKDGLCAEQVAIGSAIADGYTKGDFDCVYLLGSANHSITPCFLCRQLLVEFFDEASLVITYDVFGNEKKYKVSELCPYTFSEEDLKND